MNGRIRIEVLEEFLDAVNHKLRNHPMGDYGVGMATIEGWTDWRDQMEAIRNRIERPIFFSPRTRMWIGINQ